MAELIDESQDIEVTDRDAEWSRFLRTRYKKALATLSREYPFSCSLTIDYKEIESSGKTGIRLADELLLNPGKVIADIQASIRNHHLIKTKDEKEQNKINIRFINLPRKLLIRNIRSDDIGKFISLEGIIRKTTEVRPRIVQAVFRCAAGHLTYKIQGYGKFIDPDECATDGCNFKKLEIVNKRSTFVDSQKLRVQESQEGLRGGEQPQTIDVDVTDDLTGLLAPGDRVTINGIPRSVQKINQSGKSTLFDIYVECNSIEIGEKEFEEVEIDESDEEAIIKLSKDPLIYKKIINSIAPSIYGNEEPKEAIAYQVFGGILKEMPDGTNLRGDIHVLLIGDPGIAKSQLLRYVVKLSPRGIYASGHSSTSAGLTATAVKDEFGDGRWTLEAGALVLADMGVAAIDEMDKMHKDDRSALHEAMEQQSVSVAKAGITATLRARCALLGAANPKMGRFDEYVPIPEQINMPPSLLSRFDLIFVMTDKPNLILDHAIAEHIIRSHSIGEVIEQHKRSPITGVDDDYIEQQLRPVMPEIDPSLFRKYVAYAKRNCFPLISEDAKIVLIEYYMKLRSFSSSANPVPVTARQLEALVRLAEASARIRLSSTIERSDAERVVNIVEKCLRQIAYDSKTGTIDMDRAITGYSKGKRALVHDIKNTIKELYDIEEKARIEEVIKVVAKLGYLHEDISHQIDLLKEAGEIVEPRKGSIRLI